MKCPYCDNEFPLTWTRYFRGPFGKHICPNCQKKGTMSMSIKYYLCLGVFWVTYYFLAISLVKILFKDGIELIRNPFGFGCVIALGCLLVLPFDRKFMKDYRNLEKYQDDSDDQN